MNKFKPDGYNSVSPYLVVKGAKRLIELLKTIFNAKELRKYENNDGSIMHAEVRIDDSVIMIGDSNDKYPAHKTILHIYVSDVDKIYKKAIEAGCESVEEPKKRNGDPDRRGSFKDFSGNTWAIGTQK
jgi:PhnB protein